MVSIKINLITIKNVAKQLFIMQMNSEQIKDFITSSIQMIQFNKAWYKKDFPNFKNTYYDAL